MSKGRSLKYNFILNLINTIVGVIFPIVTFPYISRIIGPAGLGVINFDQSVIQYIMMFSSLGIVSYAVREISRLKDDSESMIHCSVEILLLHILLTLIGYIAVIIIYLFVPRINEHGLIFLVLSVSIFFNAIGVVWFFQAREDFKFLLIRSLIVKLLSAIALFTLVKESEDLVIYAVVLVFADAANNLLNFIRLNRYIKIKNIQWSQLNIVRHLKPSIVIFAMGFIISLYLDLPSVFLGFVCDDVNVGYYATASRLTKVILTMVTALGTTLLPRMAHYFVSGDMVKFFELENKGLKFVMGFTLPISIALIIIAPELILCFSGDQYVCSIRVLQIIAPTVLFIGIAGIVGFQVLYPQGQERVIIKSAVYGLIISTVLNIWLTPMLAQDGAAISYLAAEFVVTFGMIVFGRRYISYCFMNKSVIKFIVSTLIMVLFLALIHVFIDANTFVKLAVEIVVGLLAYSVSLYCMKETLFRSLLAQVSDRFNFQRLF